MLKLQSVHGGISQLEPDVARVATPINNMVGDKAENSQAMQAFVDEHSDALARDIEAQWGLSQPQGRQILPVNNAGDGFYYSVIEKTL